MTQEELYEAIDATIAPNGQRGITAESLAALLKDIAANAGGSEQGALRVYALPKMDFSKEFASEVEALVPGMSAVFTKFLNANAATYEQLAELQTSEGDAPLIMLDLGAAMYKLATIMEVSAEGIVAATMPTPFALCNEKAEDGSLALSLVVIPDNSTFLAWANSPNTTYEGYIFNADGSVIYHAKE